MATTYHPNASSTPAWILLDSQGYIGDNSDYDDTTAVDWRSNGKPIEVSLCPSHPPVPSRLVVNCHCLDPDEVFLQKPSIVCTAEGFLLLRVAIGCLRRGFTIRSRPRGITSEMCDYFIYRPAGPDLKRLPNPHPLFFRDYEVGLLSRGNHFTVAALSATTGNEFVLHLFKSEDWGWSSKKVLLESPQDPFPVPIPENAYRLFHHITSMVITLGGEGGTIGWVDLWRGILLCDVLCDNPKLRGVPMPPPLPGRLSNKEEDFECCPKPYRGIAFIGNCLKVVELEVHGDRLPNNDPETRGPNFRIDDWTLTAYTNRKITNGNHWEIDCTVKASDVRINEAMHSELLRCGLLCKPRNNKDAERNLQNLHICQPVLSLDDNGIVYWITRIKFLHPKAWVLAVDMRNKRVEATAMIETERSLGSSLAYCPSRISSYMNAAMPLTGDNLQCLGNQLQQADERESTAAAED